MISAVMLAGLLLYGQVEAKTAGSAAAARALAAQRARDAAYIAELQRANQVAPLPGAQVDAALQKRVQDERREKIRQIAERLRTSELSIFEKHRLQQAASRLAQGYAPTIDHHAPKVGQIGLVRYASDRIPVGEVIQIVDSKLLVSFPNGRVVLVECNSKGVSDGDRIRFDSGVAILGTTSYLNALGQKKTVQQWRVVRLPVLGRLSLTRELAPQHEAIRVIDGAPVAFLKRSGANAVLQRNDGREIMAPLRSMSESDRDWALRRERAIRSASRWGGLKLVTPAKGFRTVATETEGSYRFRFRANRKSTNYAFGVVAPVGKRHVQVVLSLSGNRLHGLSLINGKPADKNESAIPAAPLKNNKPHEIELWVTHQETEGAAIISVLLNNQRIIHWQGSVDQLTSPQTHQAEPGRFAFYAMCDVDFDQIAIEKR